MRLTTRRTGSSSDVMSGRVCGDASGVAGMPGAERGAFMGWRGSSTEPHRRSIGVNQALAYHVVRRTGWWFIVVHGRLLVRAWVAFALCLLCPAVAVGAVGSNGPLTPPFTECPAVGADTSCQYLIVVTDSGGMQVPTLYEDPNAGGFYDGNDDTLVGIQNNSAEPLTSMTLGLESQSGSDFQPDQEFAFDGDGLCNYSTDTVPVQPGCTPNFTGPGQPTDTTQGEDPYDYQGPGAYFSNISDDQNVGTVNFDPPLQPASSAGKGGDYTYFSLEAAPEGVVLGGNAGNDTLQTSLTDTGNGSQSSPAAVVEPNPTDVTDVAALMYTQTQAPTGTVSYTVYSDPGCTTPVSVAGQATVGNAGTVTLTSSSDGAAPSSNAVGAELPSGATYYWQARYTPAAGDPNSPAVSPCGSETMTFSNPPSGPAVQVWETTTSLKGKSKGSLRLRLSPVPGGTDFEGVPSAGKGITITVDSNTAYQQMTGFGAMMTLSAAQVLRRSVNAVLHHATGSGTQPMQALFSSTKGIGVDLVRIPIGSNDFSGTTYTEAGLLDATPTLAPEDLNTIIPALQAAKMINPNITFIASPWSAPRSMKRTAPHCRIQGPQGLNGGAFNSSDELQYAEYLARFVQQYGEHGIPISAISVQNEPNACQKDYPSMLMSEPQLAQLSADVAAQLANLKLSTQILGLDHNWNDYQEAEQLLKDEPSTIAGTAFHCYTNPPAPADQGLLEATTENQGKGIFETECSPSGGYSAQADLMNNTHDELIAGVQNWSKSVMFLNLALNGRYGPTVNPNCGATSAHNIIPKHPCLPLLLIGPKRSWSPTVAYYTLGQLSKFVEPGAYRVCSYVGPVPVPNLACPPTAGAWSPTPGARLETVAFDDQTGHTELLVLNNQPTREPFHVDWNGRSFSYAIPAQSVQTFVWQGTPLPASVTNPPPGPTAKLTLQTAGNGSGTISTSTLTCGSAAPCAHDLPQGTSVTLTATAGSGSTFTGWSGGGCTGTSATCTVTLSANTTVTATFTLSAGPPETLTVSKAGSGSGTVSGSGIACGNTCSSSLPSGSTVTLSASPATGSIFAGWGGGGCSGTTSCTFTITTGTTVTATFTMMHILSISEAGTGSGTVTGGGISCPGTCSASIAQGTTVSLTASATAGTFTGWSGAGCTGTGTCKVTLNADTSVTATFDNPQQVTPYNNYGTANAGHAMCRGNPGTPSSDPGGTVSQTFTIPAGVATLNSAMVQIDPDSRVTANFSLYLNGGLAATASAAAAGDTHFSFGPVGVSAGEQGGISITFSSSYGSIITVYTAGSPGGTFTTTNTCSADNTGTVSTGSTGLRAVVYGTSP